MFKRENLSKVKYPVLVLAAVSFVLPLCMQLQTGPLTSAVVIGAVVQWLVYSLVYQVIAYVAAYFLVIRRGKPDSHIWFCYAVCILVTAAGLFL